jgi:UDP-N-acetylglucosamine 2-epimerase (non-hydrolysing)
VREALVGRLTGHDNVLITDTLGYATFARLLARAHLVLTDSGGVQEEAPSLDKPVLVLRETTERAEGVVAGTLRLVGTDPDRIELESCRLLEDQLAYTEMANARNPYGDGQAAQRIVAALEHIVLDGEPPVPFGPGYDRDAILRATGMRLDAQQVVSHMVPVLASTEKGPTAEPPTTDWPVSGLVDVPERHSGNGQTRADRP